MGRACVPIYGQSRMRAYPWTVAHAWIDGLADRPFCSSRACVTLWGVYQVIIYSLLVEQSRRVVQYGEPKDIM